MWTKNALFDLIQKKLGDYQLIVVANREPYIHHWEGGKLKCSYPASGMVTAIDPIMRACGGIWVAHGSGSADRRTVDADDHVPVPPDDPSYTLRRVWLTKEQEDGYYYGLANEGLWPLCHVVFTRPWFHPKDWQTYREVNRLFADVVVEEAGDRPTFVFIQDYHFALLPRLLKQRNPNLIVAQFWHIPWPNRETFRVFPWKEELLDGLLGNDLLGFHLRYHCQNFLETVDRGVEARIDLERSRITRRGHDTLVRPFPISIDFEEHQQRAHEPEVDAEMERWRQVLRLNGSLLGIGIERLDYTKGIPERLRAIDRLMEKYPAYHNKLIFVQVAVPSRSHIEPYKRLDDEIDRLVDEINWKWSTESWRPIHYFKEHHDGPSLMALHRLANFCVVSSLHDGLNLVAKEFVASRFDQRGVLILSEFAGSAWELTDALLINPFDIDHLAEAMRLAVEMPEAEQERRMRRLRNEVASNNIFRWAGKIISALLKLDSAETVAAKELV
jgi:trehalose 6-phosphate synthase